MSVEEDRRRALDQMLAARGANAIGANDRYYGEQIAPVMSAPTSSRAAAYDQMWAERNKTVGDSARANVGGYGAALNLARQQAEKEALRKEAEAAAKKGRGGGRSGGGGGGSAAPMVDDGVSAEDPFAWVKDYIANNTYTGAPTPGAPTGPSYNSAGGGRPAGIPSFGGRTRTPSTPYSKPKVVQY